MKNTKRTIAVVLAAMLVIAMITGCTGKPATTGAPAADTNAAAAPEAAASGGKGTIACLCPSISIDYYKQVFYGVISAAEEKGYDVQIITGMTSVEDQVSAIDDLVEAGVSAIVVSPMDSYGIASALDLCKERGVVFVANDEAYGTDNLPDCRIINQNIAVGTAVAEGFAASMNYTGNVIILEHSAGVAVYAEKIAAMKAVFEKYNMPILASMETGGSVAGAQQVLADLLQQYSDVDGVITFNEVIMQGAMVALEEAGYELGTDVKLASSNYSVDLTEYIRDGRMSGAIYSWGFLFGEWSVDMIERTLAGEAVPSYIAQPYSFVDQSTIDEFDKLSSVAHNFNFDSYILS